MHKYFKHDAASEYGDGVAYLEFDGDWATRQIEIYGETVIRSSDPEEICDQPLGETELGPEHEISAAEFERVWSSTAPPAT